MNRPGRLSAVPAPARSSLALILAAAAAAQTTPAGRRPVEDVLPASTYACARFDGLAACTAAVDRLPIAGVVRDFLARLPEPTRQQHLEAGLGHAAGELRQHLQQMGCDPADLRTVLQRPVALGVGRVTLRGMGPSLALVVDEGGAGAAFDRMWAAAVDLAQRHGHWQAGEEQVAGASLHALHNDAGLTVLAGHVDGYFVVSNSAPYVHDIRGVIAGRVPALAQASRLHDARARLGQPVLGSLFLNTQPAMAALEALLPYEAGEAADLLGIGRLDGIYGAFGADGEVFHAAIGGSEKGLFKALHAAPADLGFARRCSPATVAFAATSFDVPAVVDAAQRLLAALPAAAAEGVRHEILRDLQRELRHAGTTPEALDTLLRAFGNQVGFAFALEQGTVPKPELLVSIAVRDWAPVRPLLQHLEAMTGQQGGVEWKTRQVGDRQIRFCNVPLPEAHLQLSPCYAETDGALLFASDTMTLARALGQNADESLAAQPDFVAAAQANHGASGLLHLRLFRAAELGWRSVETLFPLLDAHKDQVGFDSEALPDKERMIQALGTATMALHVDTDGVTFRGKGLLGLGTLMATAARLGDLVLREAAGRVY